MVIEYRVLCLVVDQAFSVDLMTRVDSVRRRPVKCAVSVLQTLSVPPSLSLFGKTRELLFLCPAEDG